MDKSAFLDAMNITRWRSADKPGKPFLVLHDVDADLSAQQFIESVLAQLDITLDQCDFDCEVIKGPHIVWDMRKVKRRPRVAWLVSAPLDDVLQSVAEKRLLWQQICLQREKTA